MANVFVLGPSIAVTEPTPGAPVAADVMAGRRRVVFDDPPTRVGGQVNLKFISGTPEDVPPINLYAFYVQPPTAVPPPSDLSPDWFFASQNGVTKSNGSVPISSPGPTDAVTIQVPNVVPGAHHVQVIYEFKG
jgi:hypothetical protein